MTARDDGSGEPPAEVRRDWLEHELGDDWVAQGDGTYRFVGASRDAPIARDDSHASDEERGRADATDEPVSHEPRHLRLPWRRH
jgi:hypothetical protein